MDNGLGGAHSGVGRDVAAHDDAVLLVLLLRIELDQLDKQTAKSLCCRALLKRGHLASREKLKSSKFLSLMRCVKKTRALKSNTPHYRKDLS